MCALIWSSLLTSLSQKELAKKKTEEKKGFLQSIIDKVVNDGLARDEANRAEIAKLKEQLNKKTN